MITASTSKPPRSYADPDRGRRRSRIGDARWCRAVMSGKTWEPAAGCRRATQGSGSPSSMSSRISVGIPLIVRVTGATRIRLSTGMASLRVTTRTGRRRPSDSAHQISPCTAATTALRRSWTWSCRRSIPPRPRPEVGGGIPRRSRQLPSAAARCRPAPADFDEPRQISKPLRRLRQAGRLAGPSRPLHA